MTRSMGQVGAPRVGRMTWWLGTAIAGVVVAVAVPAVTLAGTSQAGVRVNALGRRIPWF